MFFDTPVYFVFLIFVVGIYWSLTHRLQNRFLLVASYFFYGWWDYRFLGLIFISTIVDFYCARAIDNSSTDSHRKALLTLSLVVNLSFLGFFKYYNFFADSLTHGLNTLGFNPSPRMLSILLPPGISFYTFQAVAYIVDIYKRRIKPAESLIDYALFISLFPHLIAGPIQRPDHLLPQVQQPRRFNSSSTFDGIMLILTGLFRKCVIADSCALLANAAFGGQLGEPNLYVVLIGTYAFAWQIYGDFSGYSDIARGSAQVLGFHFMVNFRQPYFATSLQDFWRRWHISLSTWLRDYLYFPLGGNRHGELKTSKNLLTTMLLGGLWHGANWTFVVWGALHGVWLAVERRVLGRQRPLGPTESQGRSFWARVPRALVVFHVVCLSWVFFRAESLSSALTFLGGLGQAGWRPDYGTALMMIASYATLMTVLDARLELFNEEYPFSTSSTPVKIGIASLATVATLYFSANASAAFIYFQF